MKYPQGPKRSLGGISAGLFLLALAFWAGSQKDAVWGMLGFLPFFVTGMLLIIKSFKGGDEEV